MLAVATAAVTAMLRVVWGLWCPQGCLMGFLGPWQPWAVCVQVSAGRWQVLWEERGKQELGGAGSPSGQFTLQKATHNQPEGVPETRMCKQGVVLVGRGISSLRGRVCEKGSAFSLLSGCCLLCSSHRLMVSPPSWWLCKPSQKFDVARKLELEGWHLSSNYLFIGGLFF